KSYEVGAVAQAAKLLAVEEVPQQHVRLVESGIRPDGSAPGKARVDLEDDDAVSVDPQLNVERAARPERYGQPLADRLDAAVRDDETLRVARRDRVLPAL